MLTVEELKYIMKPAIAAIEVFATPGQFS